MANTIQFKRRTSAGSGPLLGTNSIKAGEPLFDPSGSLYVARATKDGNVTTPLVESDYVEFQSKEKVASAISTAIGGLALGTAASKNTGTSSGCVPLLDANGKLADSTVPKIAITESYVVASEAEMLALTAEIGDVAIRTDLKKSFILSVTPATTLANWKELLTPTDTVQSVNGKTGTVNLTYTDIGAAPASHETNTTLHFSQEEHARFNNLYNTRIKDLVGTGSMTEATSADITANCITDGILFNQNYNTEVQPQDYTAQHLDYIIGINRNAVLTPTSIIDGGTF